MRRGHEVTVFDEPPFAPVIEAAGAPADLRKAVDTIAADLPGFRARAAALGRSLRETGGFSAAATTIESMVERRGRSGAVQARGRIQPPQPP